MPEKLVLLMRDPRKAPYDVPLLVKTASGGYVVAQWSSHDLMWYLCDEDGRIVEYTGSCDYYPWEIGTPQIYCELPK